MYDIVKMWLASFELLCLESVVSQRISMINIGIMLHDKSMCFFFQAIPSIDFKNVVKCCTVSDVTSNRKGLIAYCDISAGNFILEYRGTLMSHQRFEELHPMFKESCPYVVMYNKIKTLQLVIDARNYGNDARFVRRSCTPNAEVCGCCFQTVSIIWRRKGIQ